MGGEHGPVVVYGFKTDIIFTNDDGFDICVSYEPGNPIYTSIIIQDTDFKKVLEKMNKYIDEKHQGISDIENWAKEKSKKYNKNYECKWQLALCGELDYHDVYDEQDIIQELLDYNSNSNSDSD